MTILVFHASERRAERETSSLKTRESKDPTFAYYVHFVWITTTEQLTSFLVHISFSFGGSYIHKEMEGETKKLKPK